MNYLSTRGEAAQRQFDDILLEGLAPDGGLYLPDHYPSLTRGDLQSLQGLSYPDLAFEILRRYTAPADAAALRQLVHATYTAEHFGSDEIVRIKPLSGGMALLGVSEGPTLAFKDMAMQLLGRLFEHALARSGEVLNILGATSGDTGSAAEYAMRGRHGIRVFMLSPFGKMSPFQTAQMYSLTDGNIHNIAVQDVFDTCQDMVKAVSGDLEFKRRHRIGTINSINWARVVAQVVYYFAGYLRTARSIGDPVSFAVPSGNFGNILAAHVARQMGLPIHKLILATNENNVLDEFFRTGVYRPRGPAETHHTSSPSMDISKASNFERFIADLTGRDYAKVAELWQAVDRGASFDLKSSGLFDKVKGYGLSSGHSSHADRMATIRRVWEQYGVMIDTHTADGLKVGLERREPGVPLICLETALPAKFEDAIREALGREPERPQGLENLEALPQRYEVLDADTDQVRAYISACVV